MYFLIGLAFNSTLTDTTTADVIANDFFWSPKADRTSIVLELAQNERAEVCPSMEIAQRGFLSGSWIATVLERWLSRAEAEG